MKKTLIAALMALGLLAPLLSGACSGAKDVEGEGFSIYLTRDDVPVSDMEMLSHIEIADTPVIGTDDIVSYKWNTHGIILTEKAFARILYMEVPATGRSFVVCVDKNPVYWGAFLNPVSSNPFDGVIMLVQMETLINLLGFSLAYPDSTFYTGEDPRSNSVILKALEKAGKLK